MANAPDSFSNDVEFMQIAFATNMRGLATCFYDDNHQPFPQITGKLKFRDLSEGIPAVQSSSLSAVRDWLFAQNIREVAPYKMGNTATILVVRSQTHKVAILRVPRLSGEADDHKRIDHPAVLQPFPGGALAYHDRKIELLPFTMMMGLNRADGTPDIFARQGGIPALVKMYNMSGLFSNGVKDDLSVLPDGSVLAADPDILRFLRGPSTFAKYAEAQTRFVREFPYLASMAHIKDGRPSQEAFFGADYLSTPLRKDLDFKATQARPTGMN